jgi:glucosylceramidase
VSIQSSRSSTITKATVSAWLTTPDQTNLLTRQPDIAWTRNGKASGLTITVDERQSYQQMVGFGASFTDSSAWLVQQKLRARERTDLMKKLFHPRAGIGLSFLRQPLGASDFTTCGNYSYDDVPAGQTDPTLANFSLEHDRVSIIPLLKQALHINPRLRIMATPWSPPGWMKSSDSMIGGTLNASAYEPYAHYLVKCIQAYAAEGVPLYAITPQNEPLHAPSGYPGMLLSYREEGDLIKNHIGPAFAAHGISTKILIYDHNWDTPEYPEAFHGYAGDPSAQSRVHDAYPDKEIYFTECSGGDWSPDFVTNLQWMTKNLIIGTIRHWAKTVTLWNVALDEKNGPQNGGCTDCRGVVTIDQQRGTISYNVEYYVLGHVSTFVVPGAHRIASSPFESSGIEHVAFRNPDGSKALLVLNDAPSSTTFTVQWNTRSFTSTLPAGTVATFTW